MAAPKPVTKIRTKNGNISVEYVSSVDRAAYNIIQLTRAAMKDVCRILTMKNNAEAMKLHGLKRSHRVRGKTSAFRYSVPFAKNGELPHGEVGIVHGSWYGALQEIGGANSRGVVMPKLAIMKTNAMNNISLIRETEAQYLSAIDDELKAERLIDERAAEMEGAESE